MTTKDKAKDLVDKMKLCLFSDGDYDAKQCALIAVDEMLYLLWHTHKNETEYRYYQEVKQEIEKL
jgi:hypothetical protein